MADTVGFLGIIPTKLPASVASLLTTGSADANNLIGSSGVCTGTGGSVFAVGNAVSNSGFTINGFNTSTPHVDGNIPDNWSVATLTGWNGTSPNNVTGTVTVTTVAATVGNAIQVVIACNSSGKTSANTVQVGLSLPMTFPLTGLSVGDWYMALCKAELDTPVNSRGVDLGMLQTEPDTILHTIESNLTPPNGTANMEWPSTTSYLGANALTLFTPPRIVKAGSYGTCTLRATVNLAGLQTTLTGTFRFSQFTVRKVNWTNA